MRIRNEINRTAIHIETNTFLYNFDSLIVSWYSIAAIKVAEA